MKTILVDAVNTLYKKEEGIFQEMYKLLQTYPNPKIILTGANDQQIIEFGLENTPYELFTLKHNPEKVDPKYYETLLEKYQLTLEEVIYFEHNIDAVKSAKSIGISTYHYDKDTKDLIKLKEFLDKNL